MLALAMLCGSVAEAQLVRKLDPAQIKKDFAGKDVLKVEVKPRGATATNYVDAGQILWEQTIEVHYRTEWKGITRVERGDVEYEYVGGQWKYQRIRPNDTWFVGVAPPTAKDVDAAVAAGGPEQVFTSSVELKNTTAVHSVKLDKDPRWTFPEPSRVFFYALVEYDRKSGYDLQRVQCPFQLELRRKSPTDAWTSMCGSEKPCLVGGECKQATVLSAKTLKAEEIDALPGLAMIAFERWAAPKYAALGAPETWKDAEEMLRWAYKALYSGDEKSWQAFVWKNGDRWEVFEKGRDQIVKRSADFRRQFCPELVVHERRPSGRTGLTLTFKDKSKAKSCQLGAGTAKGKPIVDRVYCDFFEGAKADEVAAIPEAEACVEAPQANKNPLDLKAGDKVWSKWGGRGKELKGTVVRVNGDKISVRYDDNSNDVDIPIGAVRRQ